MSKHAAICMYILYQYHRFLLHSHQVHAEQILNMFEQIDSKKHYNISRSCITCMRLYNSQIKFSDAVWKMHAAVMLTSLYLSLILSTHALKSVL